MNGSFPIVQYVPVIARFPQLPCLSCGQGWTKSYGLGRFRIQNLQSFWPESQINLELVAINSMNKA